MAKMLYYVCQFSIVTLLVNSAYEKQTVFEKLDFGWQLYLQKTKTAPTEPYLLAELQQCTSCSPEILKYIFNDALWKRKPDKGGPYRSIPYCTAQWKRAITELYSVRQNICLTIYGHHHPLPPGRTSAIDRLPLLVVFLLFWKNAPGYAYSTYRNAGQWWGQPSDNAFLPLAVQSSVPEAPVTGVLLEEVVSSLPKNTPKFNLLQVVKGDVSSSSDSTPQALPPNTPSSASLPVDQSGIGGLVSLQGLSGSTTSGSGPIVFAQGVSGSFPSKTGVSSQSTNDQSSPSLSSSVSQGATYGVITQAQGTSQFVPGSSSPYATISLPKYVTSRLMTGPSTKQLTSVYGTPTGSSAPFILQELLQGQDSTSQVVSVPSTPYVSVSLPQVVTSQLTPVPSSKQVTSVYTTQTGSSAPYTLQGLLQGKGSTSQVVSVPSTPYVSVSLPQVVTSQLTPVPSSKQVTSVYTTQTGSSAPFTLQELLQGQDSTSQVVSGSSTPYVSVTLPQVVTSQLTPVPSSKQVTSVYTTQTGSSAPFTLQGLLQGKGSTSQVVSVPSTPYVSVSLPQVVTSQLTPVPSSKQVTSVYTTQTGSSAPYTLQGLLQGKGSTSQVVSVPSTPYVSVSLPQVVTSQLTPVPSSKQVTSVYTTQTGSSAPFTLQELLQGQDSTSQVVSGSSTPYVSVTLPQVVSQLTPVPSSKQVTSVYTTQTGSSAPFTLQELLQGQDSTSQVVSGSSTPYVSVSLPQVVTSQLTPVPSSKQVTSVYTTQTGSSAPFTLQELLQGPDSTSQVVSVPSTPYVSVSLPQVVTSQSAVPSSKQVTSVYSTQTGSSAPFTLQGLLQGQDSTSQVVSVPSTPYVSVSLPQVVTSQSAVPSSKKITTVYDSQTGSSAPYTLQGSTTYGGLIQAQNAKDSSSTGSSSSVLQTSTGDLSHPSSSFSTLRRYYSVKG
ncbi:mucin-4-like [Danio aesculapii]|uniref:mucin-4-like n=1 Tax=Danio aesculapii TaxID=1142201 RepID=UPI0024BFB258|nr:mucin-4-like [Danio aesculapii]